MSLSRFAKRFKVRGLFWRQLIVWAVNNVPAYLEPVILSIWALLFFVVWGEGRRGVYRNLGVISPRVPALARLWRSYLVFWNFAFTFAETTHFNEEAIDVDWTLEGNEHFDKLARHEGGAIILTAHLGNYDLGSYLFAKRVKRQFVIVRASEVDEEAERFAKQYREKISEKIGGFAFNDPATNIAIPLVQALQRGSLVAIQGDRVIPGTAPATAEMFGHRVKLPAGPFALAMTARVPIFPIFVARAGWREYRVIAMEPIHCERVGRDRAGEVNAAMVRWQAMLEEIVGRFATQWFAFYSAFEEKV